MRIGVLGGTGPAGQALCVRLASVGFEVVIGSRSAERAEGICAELCAQWEGHDLVLNGADNDGAAACEIVVVATPWDAASSTAESVERHLRGKVVISMANAITKVGREFQPLVPPRGSVAASIQAAAPGAMVSAAFHHVPAKELGNLREPVESDVLVCSDHPEATEATLDIVGKIPNLRALDAGRLSNATAIEAFTAVLLQLNIRYKTRAAVKFTGIAE
jgi:NADPH-dependent F420 reductase